MLYFISCVCITIKIKIIYISIKEVSVSVLIVFAIVLSFDPILDFLYTRNTEIEKRTEIK